MASGRRPPPPVLFAGFPALRPRQPQSIHPRSRRQPPRLRLDRAASACMGGGALPPLKTALRAPQKASPHSGVPPAPPAPPSAQTTSQAHRDACSESPLQRSRQGRRTLPPHATGTGCSQLVHVIISSSQLSWHPPSPPQATPSGSAAESPSSNQVAGLTDRPPACTRRSGFPSSPSSGRAWYRNGPAHIARSSSWIPAGFPSRTAADCATRSRSHRWA